MSKSHDWFRLGKNLVTLIVVIVMVMFFYLYRPKSQNAEPIEVVLSEEVPKQESVMPTFDTVINPNNAQLGEFLRVGFTEKQAQTCINYRTKGGKFYKDTDIMKMYCISEEDYENLKDYIKIPSTKQQKHLNPQNPRESSEQVTQKNIHKVSINRCDTTELKKLPKIGGYRARKIIEYRDKLGGFYDVNQLRNVYSIDSATLTEVIRYIIIDTAAIKKINVNEASFKEIVHHPLISYDVTKNIMNYKRIVGTIKNIKELRENNIVNADEYETLKNYLKTF